MSSARTGTGTLMVHALGVYLMVTYQPGALAARVSMDNLLERVLTVHQTAMGATRLPLELQQQVYSYLDTRSFHAARNVCKWWRFASLDAVTLARQLQKLPILPPVEARKASPQELQSLWSEAANTLMLGTRVQRQSDLPSSTSAAQKMGFVAGPRVTSTTNGTRTVTINDRTIALFDVSGEQPKVMAQRPLNDLRETVGTGPWLMATTTSYYELALSVSGKLLAVAQERTVQIYDLEAASDSCTANVNVDGAAGHYICGLDFEQGDGVLRVRLSGKGAVMYLGTPLVGHSGETASFEHWKSNAGLGHTFLDSTLLDLEPGGKTSNHIARLAGMQLLQPWQQGFLLAAQRHGGNESSHYVLGYVKCGIEEEVVTAEPQSVTILARMESFLSAWDYTLNGKNESGMGLWENMPSAHEHHPTYILSPDATMLVVAERDKKAIRPVPLTQLFLYRLPSEQRMLKMLHDSATREKGSPIDLSSFPAKSGAESASRNHQLETVAERRHKVARIPICLSTIRGVVNELRFERVEQNVGAADFTLMASTAEALKTWSVADF
ncbi:hypothetical protein LTR56_015246 [Elasticomyces elasticus]|nr:hypothetical protein LTR56_015246 [Elasticomyces elasticus]KAK3644291.1 hypothetical protein LTR22_015295 [Elasticomyces elasticus]KAK4905552.1 hypothetical protein LTR49_025183 [Elasticomyces elasticus]KAK5742879.1 hypothetical protein LTS12_024062 [Elasticomyces elasticus]